MKILLIANLYPSDKDKTYGTFVKLFKEGIENTTDKICFDTCLIKGRRNSIFGKILAYFVFYVSILYKTLFTKYDIVYNHHISHTAPILRFCRFLKKFPIVMNIHGGDVVTIDKISELLFNVAIPLLQKADMIVVPSKYFMNEVLKRIPNLDESKFFISPSGGVSNLVFNKHNERSIKNRIVYVSRIDEGKGWNVLVDAIKTIYEKSNLKIHCDFYGYGTQVDKLLNQINAYGLSDICKYHGAKVHSELADIYNNSDLLVFPTMLQESLGLVGIEAMMCGCPVIGSEIGCLPEFVQDNISGYLFSPNDSKALAQSIIRFYDLSDVEKLRLSQNAIDISKNYETTIVSQNMASKLMSLFSY